MLCSVISFIICRTPAYFNTRCVLNIIRVYYKFIMYIISSVIQLDIKELKGIALFQFVLAKCCGIKMELYTLPGFFPMNYPWNSKFSMKNP